MSSCVKFEIFTARWNEGRRSAVVIGWPFTLLKQTFETIGHSRQMVEGRGKRCCCKGRSPRRQENYDAYKVLKGRGAPHQSRRKAEMHDHKSFRASRIDCRLERRRQHSYGNATND